MPRRRSVGADSYEKCNQLEEEISRMRDMNNLLSERLSKADAELRARPEHDTSLRLNLSSLSTENTNKVCDKCPDLEEQITKLRNMIRLQNSKVETLEKQNDELRYAAPVGKVIPQVEYDRMVKERDRIREDYESVKNDYDELESRHRRYLTDHITRTLDNPRSPSKTSDSIDGKSVEYEQLKRCNEDLEKRIDLFQSQSSLAENTKKRTEEKIQKLEAEVHELKVALATKNQERVKSGKLPIVIWTGEEDANDDEIIQAVMKEMDDGEEESWDDDHDESDSDGVDDDNTELVDFKSDPTDSTDITPASQPVAIVSDAKTHASLASEIEQKNLIIEKIQREMQDKLEEKNQIIQRIETEKDNRLSEQTSEIAKLKKQRDELIHERKRLEKLKRELGMKIDEQNAKIEKLQENNPQYDQHELSMRIDELQNELLNVFQSSKTTQEKNEITIQHLHKQLQEKQDEIQQLEDFLTEKEDEFETLKQKKMFGSEGMEKEMGKKMEFLKKSKERQEAIVKDLKEELSRKNEQMKWWKEKHDHELQKLRQDSEEKENIIKKLESEIAQYKNDIEKKKNQITSLQEELEDEKMSKMTPRNKEITQDDLISEKDESVRKYDEELEQKTNKIKMLENKVDAQKNEIIILQEMTSAMEDKKQKNGATKCAKCQEKDKTIQTLTQEVKR
uniref:Leucine-rich repeat-containing protein DDB_G0290503-like n=1 Tax=Saccoglossus kowalevskii TaxID=10224 RepID=A0ABM0MNJ6_SACKO|nr:PREDICTED: putative leucine-rich repeat-containing protein DDB_G0290503-like [Saccoglossus kowalevskii]